MSFEISNYGAQRAQFMPKGDGKPVTYIATVKDQQGSIMQEVEYVDKNGDGKFADNEIYSITLYKRVEGVDFREKFIDTTGNGMWDKCETAVKRPDNTWLEGFETPPEGASEKNLARMNADKAARPVFQKAMSDEEHPVYDLKFSEKAGVTTKARFIDWNKDGRLDPEKELYVVYKIEKENANSQRTFATAYVDESVPPDGLFDKVEYHEERSKTNDRKLYKIESPNVPDVSTMSEDKRKMLNLLN